MSVVVEVSPKSLQYDNCLSIARAMAYLDIDVKLWNLNDKPVLQMMTELKPTLVLYSSQSSERHSNKGLISCSTINISTLNSVICDPLSYQTLDKSDMFMVDETCVIQYPEIEKSDSPELLKRLSSDYNKTFRLISPIVCHGNKYIGEIPQNLHPLIFCSATSVLALSEHTAINAFLCNSNVSLNGAKYSPTREYLIKQSNISIANKILLSMGIDKSDKYNEFIESWK